MIVLANYTNAAPAATGAAFNDQKTAVSRLQTVGVSASHGGRTEERPVSSDEDIPIHPKRKAHPEQQFIFVGDKKLKKLQKAAWDAKWWPERKKNGIMWLASDETGHVMAHGSNSDPRIRQSAR
jgi:hypothetical protein